MTTMTDKLLAKAADYEERARALRFAAAEMNGDAVESKQKTAAGTLDAAIALRKAQSNGHRSNGNGNGTGRHTNTTPGPKLGYKQIPVADRDATMRAALQAGPQSTRALQAALTAAGQGCSPSWVTKRLNAMPDVRQQGKGVGAVWLLLGAHADAPAARKHTKAAKQATRTRIAEVLSHYDRETPKAPGDVAREMGLKVSQTGFAPLVANHYLAKRKGGYIRTAKRYIVDEATGPAASS